MKFSAVYYHDGMISALNNLTIEQLAKLWQSTPVGHAGLISVYQIDEENHDAYAFEFYSDEHFFYLDDGEGDSPLYRCQLPEVE